MTGGRAVGRLRLAAIPQNPVLPLDNGAKIRNFHLFSALAERYDLDVLLSEGPRPEDLATMRERGMRPLVVPKPRRRYAAYLRSLARRVPFDFAVQANPAISDWLRSHGPSLDGVLVESIGPSLSVPPELADRMIVDTHNIESLRAASDLASLSGRRERLVERVRAAGTTAFEGRVLRACSRVYVCSAVEVVELERLGVPGAMVIPNGVDIHGIGPYPDPGGATVAFVGDLGYAPNRAAAELIAREIGPALRRRVPDCRLLVAGRGAPPGLRDELAAAGVEVRSPVVDMRDVLKEATVMIVPLRSGAGTRLKILEAFAAGRAVVSTTLGAEGIEAEDGRELILADTTGDLADATAGLLGDPGRRQDMGAAARALAERRYGWDAIGATLRRDVEDVLR